MSPESGTASPRGAQPEPFVLLRGKIAEAADRGDALGATAAAIYLAWLVALTVLPGLLAALLSSHRFALIALMTTAVGAGGITLVPHREVY